MESSEEDLKKYIYSIVPDYSYIDYFDREYALTDNLPTRSYHTGETDNPNGNPMCMIHTDITGGLTVFGYRCLLITEYAFKEVSRDVNSTNVFMKLNDYDGRHVYAFIRDADSSATSVNLAIDPYNDLTIYDGYVMELRF